MFGQRGIQALQQIRFVSYTNDSLGRGTYGAGKGDM